MTTIAAPTRYTPADVERLSHQTGKLYELVGGALVEKHSMSLRSNLVASELIHLLKSQYPKSVAHVVPETPVYCFPDGHMRRPDVSLVWTSRLPGGPTDEELHVVPDLVIEVVSPSNNHDELHDRIEEFLEVGLPLGMIVSPKHRFIHVYRKDGSGRLFRADDVIADEPALPGFRLKVADCFPSASPAKAP